MRVAEEKRPVRQLMLQHNCGIALNLAGKPQAAIDAWQRAFGAAAVVQSPSQQVRLASLVAGVYADLFDDQKWESWLALAVEANARAGGFIDNFDLPVMHLCRAFALEDELLVKTLMGEAREKGTFTGSPVRQRWGHAFQLFSETLFGRPSPEHEAAARNLVAIREQGLSGVRDFEIAVAATVIGARDPEGGQAVIQKYVATER